MNNLQKQYKEKVVPLLQEQLEIKNSLSVPAIEKVVINIGLGPGLKDKAYIENAENTLMRITGQKPVRTKARKSISSFKIREGMVVGLKVTLRNQQMWDFIEKLVRITLPRVRDFRGLKKTAFDSQGNYSIGFSEYIAFPEITADEVERLHGLEVVIKTTAKNDKQGSALLQALGFPFKK